MTKTKKIYAYRRDGSFKFWFFCPFQRNIKSMLQAATSKAQKLNKKHGFTGADKIAYVKIGKFQAKV